MSTKNTPSSADVTGAPGPAERLAGMLSPQAIDALLADADAAGTAIDGPDGLLARMTKAVLVRDRFWGQRLLEIVIDIPFALPTIVAGLVLLTLYGPSSPLGVDWANGIRFGFSPLSSWSTAFPFDASNGLSHTLLGQWAAGINNQRNGSPDVFSLNSASQIGGQVSGHVVPFVGRYVIGV